MKIKLFLTYFFLSFSFINSLYIIRSNDSAYIIFYSLFLVCLFFASIYYLNKTKIQEIQSFLSFFKYLFYFYLFDFFLQAFYHQIGFTALLMHSATSVSAILCIFLFSKIIEYDEDFIKANKFIFYLLNFSLFIGILDSLGALNTNILTPSKIIDSYNFGIFNNTAGLMEHQISFGISGVFLFAITALLNKVKLQNFFYIIILTIGIFISFARTAYLLFFLCLFTYIIHKKIIPKTIFYPLLAVFLCSLFFVNFYEIDIINQILRLERGFSGREYIVGFFLTLPFDFNQLLFGFGYQNIFDIRESILTDFEYNLEGLQFRSFHNLYLSTTVNSGILLASLYFISQIKIYYSFISDKSNFSSHALMVMIIFIVGNLFVEFRVGGIRIISLYFSMFLAFIYNYQSKKYAIQE